MSFHLRPAHFYEAAIDEIRRWPEASKREFGTVLLRLQKGELVGMPDVRSMPSIGNGVHEIRIRNAAMTSRIFYVAMKPYGLLIFHAFIKKSQKTPQKEIETGKKWLRIFLEELGE